MKVGDRVRYKRSNDFPADSWRGEVLRIVTPRPCNGGTYALVRWRNGECHYMATPPLTCIELA